MAHGLAGVLTPVISVRRHGKWAGRGAHKTVVLNGKVIAHVRTESLITCPVIGNDSLRAGDYSLMH
jgi:hypothetical protein